MHIDFVPEFCLLSLPSSFFSIPSCCLVFFLSAVDGMWMCRFGFVWDLVEVTGLAQISCLTVVERRASFTLASVPAWLVELDLLSGGLLETVTELGFFDCC